MAISTKMVSWSTRGIPRKACVNQAWKDSWDAYMRPDGSLSPSPIAPIEVQGYVYDAKYRMSSLLRIFGDSARCREAERTKPPNWLHAWIRRTGSPTATILRWLWMAKRNS